MSDQKFELSRRKALLGLGTVGVASAGAAFGTSAYFSDQEEFSDNYIQAGEFALSVEQSVTHVDQDGIGPDELDSDDNGAWATDQIVIEDAKPGDEYEFCWDITCHDNPGYVALAGDHTDQTGAENSESDVTADDLWDIESDDDLSTLGDETLVDSLKIVNGEQSHDYSGEYETLGELLDDLEDGVLLHLEDDGDEPIQLEAGKEWTLCVKLSIPNGVGNELQGARLEWSKTFYAEQARHNDDMDAFVGRAVDAHSGD